MELPDVRNGDAQRLAEMLSFSGEAEPQDLWNNSDLAAILRHQLSVPYAVDLGGPNQYAEESGASTGTTVDSPDCSFAELLQAPNPPVELLRRIKDFAKSAVCDEEFPLPRDVATVLYFASIAVALVRSGERITGLADSALRDGFVWAAGQAGVPDDLRDVFHQAIQRSESGDHPD